jgi:hypothetical protein
MTSFHFATLEESLDTFLRGIMARASDTATCAFQAAEVVFTVYHKDG